MPWVQEFDLEQTDVNTLELRAPRLMDLSLTNCDLGYVYLMEDERTFDEDYESDVEYAQALALPEATLDNTFRGLRMEQTESSGDDPASERRGAPLR